MLNDVNDFPLPDSPIRATISFTPILNEMFFNNFLLFDFLARLTQRLFI